ncbi:MAG: helicase-related protein [Flavobacteriales bacterium]
MSRQRDRAMNAFRSGKIKVLVATDIAARGIDVKGVSHVINFEIPNISETYVHRIGRTGRAGHDGVAYSMVNEGDERKHMLNIVKLIQRDIPLEEGHQWHLDLPAITLADAGGQRPAKSGGGQPQQNREGSGSGNRNKNRNKNRNRNRPPQGNGGPDRPSNGGGARGTKKPKFKGPKPQGGAS